MKRLAPVVVIALMGLAACSGETSDRDQAVDGLERVTALAALETEMASLVEDTPSDVEAAVTDIDEQAGTVIASADTGKDFEEEITASAQEIQGAGQDLASAGGDPAKLDEARRLAADRLASSNKSLNAATGLIGEDLADENGNLSAEDAETLELADTAVEQSGEAVTAAVGSTREPCYVSDPGVESSSLPIEITGDVSCEEASQVFVAAVTNSETGDWTCFSHTELESDFVNVVTDCSRPEIDDSSFVVTGGTQNDPCDMEYAVCDESGRLVAPP